MDPEVAEFLREYNSADLPPMREIPVAESRAAVAPVPGPAEQAGCVEDISIRGPSGALLVRVYEPELQVSGTSVFFHGGGWVTGDLDSHDALCRRVCIASRHRVVAVDYRRAPENRYPAAIDDSYAAVQWVSKQYPGPVAVWGDSAGGNLAAACTLMARDRNGPDIAAQVLVYPIVDFDLGRDSYRRHADGYFLTRDTMQWFWEQYAPDPEVALEPYASPLRAESLANLPPALVLTAEYDVLLDEGLAYASRLESSGVPVEQVACPGMIHGFLRRLHVFQQAGVVCARIGGFLERHLTPSV